MNIIKRIPHMLSYLKAYFQSDGSVGISKHVRTFCKVQTVYTFATAMTGTFMNIFLFRTNNHNMKLALLYTFVVLAVSPLAFMIGGYFVKKKNSVISLRMGIVLINLLYIFLLLLQTEAARFMIPLACFHGFANGFYYLGYNTVIYDYSDNENREKVVSLVNVCTVTATALAPIISGYIISHFKDTFGYIIVFSLSFILSLVALLYVAKLPSKKVEGKYYLKSTLLLPLKNKQWRNVMFGEIARCPKECYNTLLLPILLYLSVQQEWVVGMTTFGNNLASVFAFFTLMWFLKPKNRARFILLGTFMILLANVLLVVDFKDTFSSVTLIVCFNFLNSFFSAYILAPTSSIILQVVSTTNGHERRRIECIVARECYLTIGRLIGGITVLLIPFNKYYIVGGFLAFSLLQFAGYSFMEKAHRQLRIKALSALQRQD